MSDRIGPTNEGLLLADCRYPLQAASWRPDDHGDVDPGGGAITRAWDQRWPDVPRTRRLPVPAVGQVRSLAGVRIEATKL